MSNTEQRKRVKDFIAYWTGRGYEKGESQKFWLELLGVLGVENPSSFISFEDKVHLDHTSFIDGRIPSTHVLIEQKSLGKDLRASIKQSDGSYLTPFQQAKRYSSELPVFEHPRWIVTCNFAEFLIYDMQQPQSEPESILLKDLGKEFYRLNFLVKEQDVALQKEMEVSLAAGELVGRLYDALLKQYINPASPQTLHSLNVLCVRLVFCLYAEDAGLFDSHTAFHDYLASFNTDNVRTALISLFHILDTPKNERDPYEKPELLAFPYVNGGLFADETIEIPRLTDKILHLLLKDCSADFDWSGISPTIFGAVFESTLNPETRRTGGMHYTSIENIHKVIDPLFLDSLIKEIEKIERINNGKRQQTALVGYVKRLASLTFFDPACGSGNFLTETFLSLRRLENRALKLILKRSGRSIGGEMSPIKVSISQFYGIEINDFAATVAKTALWIAESQMIQETADIVGSDLEFLPLKTYTNITVGNALRIDWRSVIGRKNPTECRPTYIMGNPPFVGYSLQSREQKEDILSVFINERGKPYKAAGKIDYVAGWYFKAAQLIQGTATRCAFVSTNSITQGEQVASVWRPIFERFNIRINFAHRTFRWDSEATLKAHVHCVIIGFSYNNASLPQNGKTNNYGSEDSTAPNIVSMPQTNPVIFNGEMKREVHNINAYLMDAPDVFVESRSKAICDVPPMITGNRPTDGGNLIIEADEYDDFIIKEPDAIPYIKRLVGSDEFINRKNRYCLWLVGASPDELRKMPKVRKRIILCKQAREKSTDAGRRKLAETPMLFRETNNPKSFVLVPKVSSERRKYVPMGFLNGDTIPTDLVFIIPNATLYHFGVLTSIVHMAWMRAVCGRLKSDYRYSKDIVYNNFPWPEPTKEQRERIEETAQAILDVRSRYADSSLAALYDDVLMPPELRKAHQQNDRAVMAAYGFPMRNFTESDCVARLMKMYKELTK